MSESETKPCEFCGKPVTKTKAQQSQRRHWTCGRSCSVSLAHRAGNSPQSWAENPYRGQKETRPCATCGKPVTRYLTPERINQAWTCSYKCAGKQKYSRDNILGGKKPRRGDYINCSVCGKEFYRQPAYIKQNRHLCSRECNNAWQGRNKITKTCPQCGKEFKVAPSEAAITHCSFACQNKSRIKRPTGRAHNGRPVLENSQGYLTVYEPTHPKANISGRVLEHRLVMEKELGRMLATDEHVHHINHNRQDNRPENLTIMDANEHGRETNAHTKSKRLSVEERLAEYERRFGPLE